MTAGEALTVILIAVVGALTTAALYVGLLGMLGAIDIVRCDSCSHLTLCPAQRLRSSCIRCRHPLLLHPMRAIHHPRKLAEARVRANYRVTTR
jgi:hypothetical protein